MCPNWICTVVSPYRGGGGTENSDLTTQPGSGQSDGHQVGKSGGNAGDRARADGLVLATPSPPAPAAAGAPGSPRLSPSAAPLPAPCPPPQALVPGRVRWGRGFPSESIFSTENSTQQAESMQHAAVPGGVPPHGAGLLALLGACLGHGVGAAGGRGQVVGARSPQPCSGGRSPPAPRGARGVPRARSAAQHGHGSPREEKKKEVTRFPSSCFPDEC